MKEPSAKLLDKADRAIRAAAILLEQGEPDVAVGRADYDVDVAIDKDEAAEALDRARTFVGEVRRHLG